MTDEQKEEIRKLLREELSVTIGTYRDLDCEGRRIEVVVLLGKEKIASDWMFLPS